MTSIFRSLFLTFFIFPCTSMCSFSFADFSKSSADPPELLNQLVFLSGQKKSTFAPKKARKQINSSANSEIVTSGMFGFLKNFPIFPVCPFLALFTTNTCNLSIKSNITTCLIYQTSLLFLVKLHGFNFQSHKHCSGYALPQPSQSQHWFLWLLRHIILLVYDRFGLKMCRRNRG